MSDRWHLDEASPIVVTGSAPSRRRDFTFDSFGRSSSSFRDDLGNEVGLPEAAEFVCDGARSVTWLVLIGIHVLVYLKRALTRSSEDLNPTTRREVQGATWRMYTLGAALVVGLVVGVGAVPAQHRWIDLRHHHHDCRDNTALKTEQSTRRFSSRPSLHVIR